VNNLIVNLSQPESWTAFRQWPWRAARQNPYQSIVKYFNVNGLDENSHSIHITADTVVHVQAMGDRRSNLYMYVYREEEGVIARDDRDTTDCSVAFTTPHSGYYSIRVTNGGDHYNFYKLLINLY
jgi:hypothetical protein